MSETKDQPNKTEINKLKEANKRLKEAADSYSELAEQYRQALVIRSHLKKCPECDAIWEEMEEHTDTCGYRETEFKALGLYGNKKKTKGEFSD